VSDDHQTITVGEMPNPWARISEVAARLGVRPVEFGKAATITAKGADGKGYDIFEVVIAFLDRMEKASP